MALSKFLPIQGSGLLSALVSSPAGNPQQLSDSSEQLLKPNPPTGNESEKETAPPPVPAIAAIRGNDFHVSSLFDHTEARTDSPIDTNLGPAYTPVPAELPLDGTPGEATSRRGVPYCSASMSRIWDDFSPKEQSILSLREPTVYRSCYSITSSSLSSVPQSFLVVVSQ
ncbi:hypothetical protein BKA56DRAFT_614319 [Ilyonectria sp. MPI-CAGE-AT-0026]|nr:hypothetical protein BKA56DRAFT_614319 [Ilyonectria sp. MPI-CAGE-AT-0026]